MQAISKFTRNFLIASAIILPNFATVSVLAEGGGSTSSGSNNKIGSSLVGDVKRTEFCSTIGNLTDKVMGEASKKIDTRKSNEATRQTNRTTRKSERETKISDTRSTFDQARESEFTRLSELANTEAQKTAVKAFVASMKEAIATRRAAHDKANSDFTTAVQAALDAQKSSTDSSLATLKNEINAAVEKAQNDCSAGGALDTIKSQLKSDIEAARKAFKDSRSSDAKLSEQIKSLNETRKTAVDAAKSAFKASAEAARKTLKAAFEETNTTN